jgi:hypothetical protein
VVASEVRCSEGRQHRCRQRRHTPRQRQRRGTDPALCTGSYPSTPTIYQLDNTLKLLQSYRAANAVSMYLEASAFPRKNLVVATAGDCCTGAVLDVNGNGQLEMSLGTTWGMYLTR